MLQAGPEGVGQDEARENGVGSLEAIHRLRYQVYCLERQFLDLGAHPGGRETDEYDRHAVHFAATDETGELVATLRLVLDSPLGFPLEHRATSLFPEFTRLRRALTGEVSRLILARRHRTTIGEPLLIFGLFKELYEECRRLGLEGVLATMEDGLSRLLRRLGFPFRPIGPLMDYFGPVTPYWALLDALEPGYRKILAHQQHVAKRTMTPFRFFNVRTPSRKRGSSTWS